MITITLETATPLADMLGMKLAIEKTLKTADIGEIDRNLICRGAIESDGVVVGQWEYVPKKSGSIPLAALKAARHEVRYRELTALCGEVQARMPAGVVESTSVFAKRLYPHLAEMEQADQRSLYKWLSVCAEAGAANGGWQMAPGLGYMKGKLVRKWLWGRATVNVDELV